MSSTATAASAPIPPITRNQAVVTVGIMAAIALAALDLSIVGTAMPTIIGQLGGLGQYSWVFTAYLVTSTTSVPIYARLADTYGRKPVILFGLTVFVVGSALCGFSTSMTQLILFRAIQGLGAGAVQPISFTIAGDIFEPRQRARIQGLFSAVWGVSAIFGPAVGGLMTSTVGWRWVFEINIPVGIAAGTIIGLNLHEHIEKKAHRIDWLGAVLLTASIVLLLFTVSDGGEAFGWLSLPTIALLAIAVGLFAWFVVHERSAPEPLIDLGLLRAPLVRAGLAIGALSGVVMFGVTTYVPPMVQGVHGGTPLDAGVAVAAMSIGWPIGAIIAGRILGRTGGRPIVLVGTALLVVGSLLLSQIGRFEALAFSMLACAVIGLGMGLSSTTLLVVIQGAVAWDRRAVATGLVQFSRTIGGAVGVGIMGGILTAFVGATSSAVLDPIARTTADPAALAAARDALGAGLGVVYWIIAACAIGAFLLAVRGMPEVALGAELEAGRPATSRPPGAGERRVAGSPARPSGASSRQP
jgi:EmrB/QacA subfamily drug resistance transporter